MAAQKGRDFLLKQGTAAAGTILAGMRTTAINGSADLVDSTTKDSNGWRELLEDAGTRSLSITADGVFKDTAVEDTVRGYFFANTVNAFGIVFGNGDTLDGDWQITSYQRSGGYNDAETYSITLESSGEPTFTPA